MRRLSIQHSQIASTKVRGELAFHSLVPVKKAGYEWRDLEL